MFFRFKTTLIVLFYFSLISTLKAQTPSTCFEIESILVDACDPNNIEGANEMVRFAVGPTNLNTSNLNVSWPNSSNQYKGICQNGTTSSKVATLNSSIVGCGLLIEPTGGILPAESKVILVTSTDFNVAANSFANLNDTLYIIFQCSGNTSGHFANYNSSPGLRTLTMNFSSPASCSDVVTYDRSLLINQTGGSSAEDGASVEFDWNGNATYTNNGCTAPIEQKSITINESGISICTGDTIDLSATIVGTFISTTWIGGNGTFSSATSSSTSYYSDASDNTDFYLYIEGQTTCSNPVKDSILIQIGNNSSSVSISSSTTELCAGDSILLTANGSGNYLWSTGINTSSIFISQAGTYSVTSNTVCGSAIDSIIITNAPTVNLTLTPSSTEICDGNTATLTANGADNYTWFNNNTGTSEIVNTTGDYYVIGYNNCYRDSQSVFISVITTPTVSISSSDPSNEICSGESITLTANGSGNYLWNTSDTSSSIIITTSGTYSVTSTNSCFSASDNIIIDNGTNPISSISGDTIICQNEATLLTASGGDSYMWSNGSNLDNITVSDDEQGYVVAMNGCGNDTAYFHVHDYGVYSSFTSDFVNGTTAPITINFNNTSSGNITNYMWSFGDNETSTITNPSHTYTTNGEYIVTLTSFNTYCSDNYEFTVLLENPNTVYIPNVFTPNNDGINDEFEIKGENIKTLECNIFNRWGQKLYSFDSKNDTWDGTFDGNNAVDGTYFYIIYISWNNDEKETFNGSITLLK